MVISDLEKYEKNMVGYLISKFLIFLMFTSLIHLSSAEHSTGDEGYRLPESSTMKIIIIVFLIVVWSFVFNYTYKT